MSYFINKITNINSNLSNIIYKYSLWIDKKYLIELLCKTKNIKYCLDHLSLTKYHSITGNSDIWYFYNTNLVR
jgi:hypothetical protein